MISDGNERSLIHIRLFRPKSKRTISLSQINILRIVLLLEIVARRRDR